MEWALKPPLQSLCGWRRNAQTCRQLVERPAFVGFHCAGGSSVEQDSPAEPKMVARAALLVENGPDPAKSRRAANSRHLTSATKVAGAKNLPNEPPGGSSKIPRGESTGPGWWTTDRPDCPPGGSATYTGGPLTPRRFLTNYSHVRPLRSQGMAGAPYFLSPRAGVPSFLKGQGGV